MNPRGLWFAQFIVNLAALYLSAGSLFALWLVTLGLKRLDAATRHASLGLRLLLLPGAIALWPWLAWRSYRVEK